MTSLVLITGISGYLGSEVALQFLETSSHRVRGAVRTQSQADQFNAKYPQYKDRIEFVIVESISVEGAFAKAVEGVELVAHTASPVPLGGLDFDVARDLLIPAIQGTVGILQSCLLEPKIKAVVITSSVAALRDYAIPALPGQVYTSADWNKLTYEETLKIPKEKTQLVYSGSKALAEKAAWDFMAQHTPSFTLTTILPTFILGPSREAGLSNLSQLRSSTGMFWRSVVDVPVISPASLYPKVVDIRDVAFSHVQALLLHGPSISGQRYLLVAHDNSAEYTAQLLRKNFPQFGERIAPTPEELVQLKAAIVVDGTPAEKAFGFKYRGVEETIKDWGESLFALPA